MEQENEKYLKKLQNYYDNDGLLLQYPTKRPMRIFTLIDIVKSFDAVDNQYTEKQVNERIKNKIAFTDVELIRREMFQYGFLGRLKDGSRYWVEENWKEKYNDFLD